MPAQRTRLALVLLALGALLHLYRLAEPRRVVFDEVHFGGFVTNYLGDHSYFFDIHPPHAKLLIAGVAALGGYRGSQPFEKLDQPIEKVSPGLLRLVPALSGILLPLVLFGLLLQLGASPAAAFLGGLAVLLDNAILLQTRVIALDGILLLATFGGLSAVLAALSAASRVRASAFALLAGALAGLAAGTKFTGLAALPVVGACIAATLLPRPSWASVRRVGSLSVWVLSGAFAVYAAGWVIHFALLTEPGIGYVWAVPTGDFLFDTVRIHRLMLASNYGLTAPHPYASAWWSWPLMLRPVYYWNHADSALYFVGNPALWWGTTLGCVLLLGNLVLLRVSELRLATGGSPWPPRLWIPLLGYVISLLPLVRVPRALFLYHYLTALLFALCAVLLWLDRVGWTRPGGFRRQRASYFGAIGALVLGFVAISPFTFAFVTAPAYREWVFGLFPGWR
jgi:dolichyl-phosphate-mannose--protein O-mannosyl transferase